MASLPAVTPVTLDGAHVRLKPLTRDHDAPSVRARARHLLARLGVTDDSDP